MRHVLKTWPAFFDAIALGRKTFEVRRNDRGFNAGDVLCLREYDPTRSYIESARYTGRTIDCGVSYVLSGEAFGIKDGFVVMAIAAIGGVHEHDYDYDVKERR